MEDSEEYKHNLAVLGTLNIGDIVEFPPSRYSHWGVYVGGGNVISLIPAEDRHRFLLANDPSQSSGGIFGGIFRGNSSGSNIPKEDLVRKSNFFEVAGKSKAKKNNLLDNKNKPLNPTEIMKNAESKVGRVDNKLFSDNCDFASWCRYGDVARSQKLKATACADTAMECDLGASSVPLSEVSSKLTEEARTKQEKPEFKLTSNNSKDFAGMCRYGKTGTT